MGLSHTSEKTPEAINGMMSNVRSKIYRASCNLAKKRGKYVDFDFPIFLKGLQTTEGLSTNLLSDIETYGLRFQLHMMIAPGSTSSKALGLVEGIEPIVNPFYIEDNDAGQLPSLAPGIVEFGKYYEICWDVPNKTLIDLAAVRQRYLDQGQSVNTYYKESACKEFTDLAKDIIYAWKKGLKALYYMKVPTGQEAECVGCS